MKLIRIAHNEEEALVKAEKIGYPLVVRPSYVLGGRAMQVVHSAEELQKYMREAVQVSEDSPVLLDFFLNNAIEIVEKPLQDGRFSDAIEFSVEGKTVARLGKVSPKMLKKFDIEQEAFYAEIELEECQNFRNIENLRFIILIFKTNMISQVVRQTLYYQMLRDV